MGLVLQGTRLQVQYSSLASVVLHDNCLALVASLLLHLHLEASEDEDADDGIDNDDDDDDDDEDEDANSSSDDEMMTSQ